MYVKNSSGTTLVAFKSDGNVSIGSHSPTAALHLKKAGVAQPFVVFEDTGTNSNPQVSVKNDAQQWGIQTVGARNDNFEVWDQTGGATRLAITTDGNIGIGTTDPSAKLHVIGAAFIDNTGASGGLTVEASSEARIILQAAQNTAYHAKLSAHYNYTTPMTLSGYGGTVLAQNTGVTKTLLYANNAEQIRITATGVGIGLGGSDPSAKLHVVASTDDGIKINANNAIIGQTSGTAATQLLFWSGTDAYLGRSISGLQNGTVTSWNIRTGGADKVIINSTGLGIGGTPSSPLTLHMTGGSYTTDATSGFIISNTSSGRATQRIRTVNNDAAELFFDVNGAARWDFSVRNSGSDYKLNLYNQAGSPSYTAVSGPVMTWLQNGNVGIGTDTPAFSSGGSGLEIERTTATLRLQHAGSHASEIYQNTSAFNIADLSSGNIVFKISNADKMRLTSTGLGIGVIAAPNSVNSTKLDVRGSIYFDNNALIASMGGENSNVDHIWHDDGSYDGAGGAWNFVSDGGYKGAGNSRLYAGHVYMAGSGTNYFNGAITANSNLTLSGSLLGVSNSSLSQIGNTILDTNGEDLPVINHQLNNDLALMDAKGGTVTYGGLSSTPGSTANAFRSDSTFITVTSSTISNSSNGFTITLESLPRALTYSTRVGITFAHDGWRCSYVKIEVYRAGAWTQIREETSNTKATVYQFYNTSSSSITKIRYTLKTPVTTSTRIVSLFAFSYNSSGNSGYYLSQAGGTIYGQAGFGTGTFGSNNVLTITNAGTNAAYSAIALGTATTGHGNSEGYWIGMIENGEAYLWNYESRAIIFGTSNVETMRIHSNANVSIGTTSSAYGRLFVDAATTAANTALAVRGRDSSASYIALNVMNNADGELFSILNNGRAKFTGSVGIGTGSPQTDLQIGDATGNPKLLIFGASHSSASSQILFGDWSASGGPYYAGMGIRYNSNHNKLHFDDNATSTNNTIMTLDRDTQTVGIGTETPSAPLHIFYEKSTAYAAIKIRNFNNASACILYEDAYGNSEWATGHNYATNDWRVSQAGNSNTGLLEYPKLVVRNGGNVGIGSVFPEAKLVVNGDTYIVGNVGIGTTPGGSYKLEVNGAFAASSKSFVIDHPTKENKKLIHGSLEGPEYGVYHRGTTQSNTITLPDYWSGLVREDTITVQLTPRGGFQHLYVVSASLSQIVIGAADGETIDCFYTIYGERADIDSLVVEKDV